MSIVVNQVKLYNHDHHLTTRKTRANKAAYNIYQITMATCAQKKCEAVIFCHHDGANSSKSNRACQMLLKIIKYTTAYIVLYHKTLQAKSIIQLLPLYFQSSGKFKTIDISLKFLSAIPDISKPIIIKTQYPNISVIDSYDGVQDTRELKFQCNPTELQAKVRLIRDICGNATIDYTCPVYEYIKYKNK